MKSLRIASLLVFALLMTDIATAQDWGNLNKYKSANAGLYAPESDENRVVFMGNSITEAWANMSPDFFKDNNYIGRGISGQTTPQMLVRFRQDVIKLRPKVVVIIAGTNDIAGNTGPMSLPMILENLKSMAELAKAHNIKVVLSAVLPVYDYPWKPGQAPAQKIPKLNAMIKSYALRNHMTYLDYYSAMVDDRNGLQKHLGDDGVHPNKAGYDIMEPLAKKAILKALGQ